jgi:hypothetical protein
MCIRMNKEPYMYLFTYNAFVALRRPVGCSQDCVFPVSQQQQCRSYDAQLQRCCYDTGKHTRSGSPHLHFWCAEFKSQRRFLITSVGVVSLIGNAHMQIMDTNTHAATNTCRSSCTVEFKTIQF